MATVRRFYFKHHADHIRSRNAAKRAFTLVSEYLTEKMKERSEEGAPKVGMFGLAHQEGFMRWCRDRYKLSNKTISLYLGSIKSALRFAARPRLVRDGQGREREVIVLNSIPFIEDSQEAIQRVTGLSRSVPRDAIPTMQELARFIDAIDAEHEHIFRYIVLQLNTWARPEAICELSVRSQVNFTVGTVDMNPPGRAQNNKRRPLLKLTNNLRGWILHWNLDRPIVYQSRPVRRVDNRTLAKIAEAAKLHVPFTRYTLRHFMATHIRKVEGFPVAREERAAWLGHVDNDLRITELWYETHDDDYLAACAAAIDALLDRLNGFLDRRSVVPPATARTHPLFEVQPGFRKLPKKTKLDTP